MHASASEIDSADISCDESFETECSIAGGSSCDNEDLSCGYLGEPEYTEPINQLNLVLRAAVVTVTSWTLVDWKIYTGVHFIIVHSCQHWM